MNKECMRFFVFSSMVFFVAACATPVSKVGSDSEPTVGEIANSTSTNTSSAITIGKSNPTNNVPINVIDTNLKDASENNNVTKISSTTIKKDWGFDIGSSFNDDSKGFQIINLGDRIAAANQSGRVFLLDQDTGNVVWRASTKSPLLAGVGAGNNNIYVATEDGEVVAFSETDGAEKWRFQASSEVLSAPVSGLGTVIVRSSDGRVSGLSSKDGSLKWVVQRDLPRLSLRGDSQTLIFDGVAVIGLPSGSLLAIELLRGTVLWDLPITLASGINDLERINDIYATPLIVGDTLLTATYQGEVVAINIPNRQRLWRAPISSYKPLATDGDLILVVDDASNVIALDINTGARVWENKSFSEQDISGAFYNNIDFLIFDNDGQAYNLNPNTGKTKSTYKVNSGVIIGEPLALQQGFVVLTKNGKIARYLNK